MRLSNHRPGGLPQDRGGWGGYADAPDAHARQGGFYRGGAFPSAHHIRRLLCRGPHGPDSAVRRHDGHAPAAPCEGNPPGGPFQ